ASPWRRSSSSSRWCGDAMTTPADGPAPGRDPGRDPGRAAVPEPARDDVIVVPHAGRRVPARVEHVYGPATRRYVLVWLTPQLSDGVVDRPTPISVLLADLR